MSADPAAEVASYPPECAALESALAAEKEMRLRLAADFDNHRKRAVQEGERRAAAQKESFIRDLLPAIDNLERALAAGRAASLEQLRQGVQMTLGQMQQLLRRHRIEPEESLGRAFDPHRHEALRTACDPGRPDQSILEVFERGYRRGNDLFRPATVVVNDLSGTGGEQHAG